MNTQTMTIYRITVTQAYRAEETGSRFSLSPWGADTRSYQGYDDGGQQYLVPAKYRLSEDASGEPHLYDGRDTQVEIVGTHFPAIVNDLGLLERLAKA